MPDPVPAPIPVMINIVGTFGTTAFNPNPTPAVMGDLIVWTNNDLRRHALVFDDGTPIGDIGPGESTMPVALTTPTATYHCTIHPSMVGTIDSTMAVPGIPPSPTDPAAPGVDPAPGTPPPPAYEPPPYDGGYYYRLRRPTGVRR